MIFYQLCCGMPFTRGVLVPGARPSQHSEDQRSGWPGPGRLQLQHNLHCADCEASAWQWRQANIMQEKSGIDIGVPYPRQKDSFFDNSIRRMLIVGRVENIYLVSSFSIHFRSRSLDSVVSVVGWCSVQCTVWCDDGPQHCQHQHQHTAG